jgi:hypothetical protein
MKSPDINILPLTINPPFSSWPVVLELDPVNITFCQRAQCWFSSTEGPGEHYKATEE